MVFLLDFMLIFNGTGHSFIGFFNKKGDIIIWIFLRYVKKLLEQNFSLIKVNFGRFFHGQNFAQIIGRFFSRKFHHKKSPEWRNFAQSGHPGRKYHFELTKGTKHYNIPYFIEYSANISIMRTLILHWFSKILFLKFFCR